jgi:predicted phosphodiesterase
VRVAALYDVHGNLPALDAVLAEVDADVIIVGGDFVAGPWPAETLERLRGLAGDVRFIRGNADRELYEEGQGMAPPEVMEFVRERLSADHLAFRPRAAADRDGRGRRSRSCALLPCDPAQRRGDLHA